MGPVCVIQYGRRHKQWKPKCDTEKKIINRSQAPPKNQHEENFKLTGMLCDNKLRPLNPDPCLPELSEGVANRSDLPTNMSFIIVKIWNRRTKV